MNKREKAMIAKLREAGLLTESQQENAKFCFMVRPMTSPDIDCIELASRFEQEVFSLILKEEFNSSIRGIIFFPKIIDPDVGTLPDQFSFKKKEQVFFISGDINYYLWKNTQDDLKADLLSNSIKESLLKIPQRYFGEKDRNKMLEIIENVNKDMKLKLIN